MRLNDSRGWCQIQLSVETEETIGNQKETEIIEEEIVKSIIIQSKESCVNYKLANKHFHNYTKLMCIVLKKNNEILYKLIKHEEPSVKSAGAYFLLQYDKSLAEKTLKSLYKISKDTIGFNAKMIMREWKNRRLKFPKLKEGKIIYESTTPP